jgi:hypothetical protein
MLGGFGPFDETSVLAGRRFAGHTSSLRRVAVKSWEEGCGAEARSETCKDGWNMILAMISAVVRAMTVSGCPHAATPESCRPDCLSLSRLRRCDMTILMMITWVCEWVDQ